MGLYLNSLLSTTIFFFALPNGEMCMHFRVFRRAFPNISTKREKRVRMSECCADRRALYSSTHPLRSMRRTFLECFAARRREKQCFRSSEKRDSRKMRRKLRRTTPFPLRQCHHNSTMRRHECSCEANVIITGWSELHF